MTLVSALLCVWLAVAAAQWGTYYLFSDGRIYLRLSDNGLVALDFSLSANGPDYANNQHVAALSPPPPELGLFVYNQSLYAFSASRQGEQFDRCGSGVFQLQRYDAGTDGWVAAGTQMTFANVNDVLFYEDSLYFASETEKVVYIYGGRCNQTGLATNRMLAFDMETHAFSNISTAAQPQSFYGGASVWAPEPQNTLVVGGRLNEGWLSMYQLATWNFALGWLLRAVLKNGTALAARKNALAVPVFSPLGDNSTATFLSHYRPSAVLLIGGDGAHGPATPGWLALALTANEWAYQDFDPRFGPGEIAGAAAIFNVLVVVNATSKRDGLYQLNLYDLNRNLALVQSLKESIAHAKRHRGSKAVIIGTVVPLAALLFAVGGWLLWRRKRRVHEHESIMEQDYHLGEYPFNDSVLTLEAASMDLWVKKRQEWDAQRLRKHSSFLASNETLSVPDASALPPLSAATGHWNEQLDAAAASVSEFDEQLDVQILVSSKRKSVLRVTNPDGEPVRLRNPS